VADNTDRVVALHDKLIEEYAAYTNSERAITEFTELLSEYTSACALAASQAFAELLGIDADVSMLQLTDEQYRKLEASGQLDAYIDGKDRLDD